MPDDETVPVRVSDEMLARYQQATNLSLWQNSASVEVLPGDFAAFLSELRASRQQAQGLPALSQGSGLPHALKPDEATALLAALHGNEHDTEISPYAFQHALEGIVVQHRLAAHKDAELARLRERVRELEVSRG